MPASVARRTMTLAHRLFGIRSCNEVIDGKRGRPCLEYDIKRCLAPCVESVCSIEEYGRAVDQARLLIEGRQDELIVGLRDAMAGAADQEAFERAAHLRDAIKTIETLGATGATRWKRRRSAIGMRSVSKLGSSGGVVAGVPDAPRPHCRSDRARDGVRPRRSRRRQRRAQSACRALGARRPHLAGAGAPAVLRGSRGAARSPHAGGTRRRRHRGGRGLALGASGRRVRLVMPKRGDKRGLLDLATRNAAVAYHSHFGDGATSAFDALDTLRGVLGLAGAAAPHRVLRHLDVPGPGNCRVDGRRGGWEDAQGGVQEVQDTWRESIYRSIDPSIY